MIKEQKEVINLIRSLFSENQNFREIVRESIRVLNRIKLYDYQLEALHKSLEYDKGIISMATGSGKTKVAATMILLDMIFNNKGFGIYVVTAPTIALDMQLSKEFIETLTTNGANPFFYTFNTGEKIDDSEKHKKQRDVAKSRGYTIVNRDIKFGTSIETLKATIIDCKTRNIPLVIVSTYHSILNLKPVLEELDERVSLVCHDEAHYLTRPDFHEVVKQLESQRTYCFTATIQKDKHKVQRGRGMNNKELYGNVLYTLTPRQAVEKGVMTRLNLHFLKTQGKCSAEDFRASIPMLIKHAYLHHDKVLESVYEKSKEYRKRLRGKLLVSIKGRQDIVDFLKSKDYLQLRKQDVNIFSIVSKNANSVIEKDFEEIQINGESYIKEQFFKILNEFGENRDSKFIVLHYSILTQGIDVPGFTGFLPLRQLGLTDLIQSVGRTSRTDSEDRKLLSDRSTPLIKLNKPYSYIILLKISFESIETSEDFSKMVKELKSSDFANCDVAVQSELIHGLKKADLVDGKNVVEHRDKKIGKAIEEVLISEFETDDEDGLEATEIVITEIEGEEDVNKVIVEIYPEMEETFEDLEHEKRKEMSDDEAFFADLYD